MKFKNGIFLNTVVWIHTFTIIIDHLIYNNRRIEIKLNSVKIVNRKSLLFPLNKNNLKYQTFPQSQLDSSH